MHEAGDRRGTLIQPFLLVTSFGGNQRLQETKDYLPPCYRIRMRQPQETAFRATSSISPKPTERAKPKGLKGGGKLEQNEGDTYDSTLTV